MDGSVASEGGGGGEQVLPCQLLITLIGVIS